MSKPVRIKEPNTVRTYDEDGFRRRAACICVNEDESKVLLVTSRKDDSQWIVPGGGVEPDEAAATAAVREVREEAGVHGNLGRCLGVFENAERGHRTSVFILSVTEELPEWDESKTYGRQRQWFSVEAAVDVLHKPLQSNYVKLLLPRDHRYHSQSISPNIPTILPQQRLNHCQESEVSNFARASTDASCAEDSSVNDNLVSETEQLLSSENYQRVQVADVDSSEENRTETRHVPVCSDIQRSLAGPQESQMSLDSALDSSSVGNGESVMEDTTAATDCSPIIESKDYCDLVSEDESEVQLRSSTDSCPAESQQGGAQCLPEDAESSMSEGNTHRRRDSDKGISMDGRARLGAERLELCSLCFSSLPTSQGSSTCCSSCSVAADTSPSLSNSVSTG